MNFFDLLFLALAFTTFLILFVTVGLAIVRRGEVALRLLRRLGLGAALYFAVVIAVSFLSPRRTFNLGDTQCFDDWCIAATSAHRATANSYIVDLRISSRARRVAQRERNVSVYLVDRHNQRYYPLPQSANETLSSLLQAGQSLELTRTFSVPPAAHDLNLIITHTGFPIGWFIIGYDSWFRKPPLIYLSTSLQN